MLSKRKLVKMAQKPIMEMSIMLMSFLINSVSSIFILVQEKSNFCS